ncbi:MAG: hypothetical protein J3K34DRAFT_460375 [Monoraphidium minutum]|nr:MAG: hypothetical protein J3K34DRAFT_460375 [Monoraphidium minutum]
MRVLGMRRGAAAGLRSLPAPPPRRPGPAPRAALSAGARPAAPPPRRQLHGDAARPGAAPPPPSSPPPPRQLAWADAHKAATIASWSGLCYLHDKEDNLEARLAAGGAALVAAGRTDFTAWYVADGAIDASAFARHALDRRGAAGAAAAPAAALGAPPPRRERFVLLRGVQWGAPDLDTARMWRSLVRVWPQPLEAAPAIVAHEGAAEMALHMFDQLRPYLDQAEDAGIPVVFGGHSLGGSLSKLLMTLYRARSRRRARPRVSQPPPSCFTFGSPPVMAHAEGGGGDRVLHELGLPRGQCRNFVLQNDPIPRALLSVDPTYQMLSGLPVVQSLLELRARLAGHGTALSPQRFLFETVGEVHFIKWTPQDGAQVLLLEPGELAAELSMLSTPQVATPSAPSTPSAPGTPAPGTPLASADGGAAPAGGVQAAAAAAAARLSPLATVRAVLDHHHGSYAQELEAAAGRELARVLKEAAAGAPAGAAAGGAPAAAAAGGVPAPAGGAPAAAAGGAPTAAAAPPAAEVGQGWGPPTVSSR